MRTNLVEQEFRFQMSCGIVNNEMYSRNVFGSTYGMAGVAIEDIGLVFKAKI